MGAFRANQRCHMTTALKSYAVYIQSAPICVTSSWFLWRPTSLLLLFVFAIFFSLFFAYNYYGTDLRMPHKCFKFLLLLPCRLQIYIHISTELLLFWAIHSFPFGMFIYFLFSFVVGVIVVLLLFLLLRKLLLFLHTTTLLCVVLDDSFDTSEWALVTHKCTHTHLLSIYSIVLCATRWQTHAILKWKRNKNTKFTGGSQVAAGKCGFWWLARGIQQ